MHPGGTREAHKEDQKQTKVLNWNVEGLKGVMSSLSRDIFSDFDACILTETFNTVESRSEVKGFYNIHALARKEARGRPSGGVTCLISPKITPFEVLLNEEDQLVVKTRIGILVCVYYRPECSALDVVDSVQRAIDVIPTNERVILAGDLNCPIDKANRKAEIVLSYLEEEGLMLVNNRNVLTYICHNGGSAVDLAFVRGFDIREHGLLTSSDAALIRKHLPVSTTLKVTTPTRKQTKVQRLRRELDSSLLRQNTDKIPYILQAVNEGKLDEAMSGITDFINGGIVTTESTRRAQKWFDGECYNERRNALRKLHIARRTKDAKDLKCYQIARKSYKELQKRKKREFREREDEKLIADSEKDPCKALRPRQPRFPADITMETWEKHIRGALASKETRPEPDKKTVAEHTISVTSEEVRKVIITGKSNRAPGVDGLCNEHLKISLPYLEPIWTRLMNKCIETGNIPSIWRKSILKLLYKGKGDVSRPESYRGIALESVAFKLLTKLLTQKLGALIEPMLPEEQCGFRKGRSTLMAAECLLKDIQEKLQAHGKKYVLFIDYTKAFDTVNRRKLIGKLESLIGYSDMTRLISNILADNHIQIYDGISQSDWICQTIGVLQGDPLSPILFNVLTHDVPSKMKEETNLNVYIYADDMALASDNINDLQKGMDLITQWAEENELVVNEQKTELMVFRRGGRLSKDDYIVCGGHKLTPKRQFKYLGITMQVTGTTFSVHLKERLAAALRSIGDIRHLQRMSINTAMELFRVKVLPSLTYGIDVIWEYLSCKQLQELESLKPRYLKRVLGVSKYALSRYAYVLARETFLVEDLRLQMLLPATPACEELLRELRKKRDSISESFYNTDAMVNTEWMRAEYELRHVVTRFAIHGFHHRICTTKSFHQACQECICVLCSEQCHIYHALECKKRSVSLIKFCKD